MKVEGRYDFGDFGYRCKLEFIGGDGVFTSNVGHAGWG